MNSNFTWKIVLILAVVVIFLYGIFGIPNGLSGSALSEGLTSSSPLRNGVHLGLDLRGGTHLILQVQVNDAVKVDADNAVERLKTEMRNKKINFADITQPDPNNPDHIVIKGVPPDSTSDLRQIVSDR